MKVETEEGLASPSPFLLAAGSLTALGLMPIPLERGGKKPVINWKALQGQALADRDWDRADEYLLRWWDRPDPYNVGVLTGAEVWIDSERTSHLIVVDVDDQDARDLVERTCGWPLTPTVRTSHGWHLWFTFHDPVGNRVKVNGVGLDVRGVGGFAVVPPSVHESGHVYSWDVGISWHEDDRVGMWPPAPLPGELAELLWPTPRPRVARRPAPRRDDRYVDVALERELESVRSAPAGSRNDQLNRSAFALARFVPQISPDALEAELVDAATAAGLPETEARRTISSAIRGRS